MTAQKDTSKAGAGRTIISVDAMGGDEGPATVVAGISLSAREHPGIGFILHGPKAELERLVAKRKNLAGICEIRDAQDVVSPMLRMAGSRAGMERTPPYRHRSRRRGSRQLRHQLQSETEREGGAEH